jgi:hypothetical protein
MNVRPKQKIIVLYLKSLSYNYFNIYIYIYNFDNWNMNYFLFSYNNTTWYLPPNHIKCKFTFHTIWTQILMSCQTLIIQYRYVYVKKNMSQNCLHTLPRPCKVNPFVKLSSCKNSANKKIYNYTQNNVQIIYISIIPSCMKIGSI